MISDFVIRFTNLSQLPQTPLDTGSLNTIVEFMLKLAAGLAVFYILIAAVKFTYSGGNPSKISEAKKAIAIAIAGLIIAVSAYLIVALVVEKASGIDAGNPAFGPSGVITTLIDTTSYVVGVMSVIMLIIGGFKYVTSGGNAQSAESAKSTVTYAIIGLIVGILAKTIVVFVLEKL